MDGPRLSSYTDVDGVSHLFYLGKNPWKRIVIVPDRTPTKVYRYCIVCGRNQYPNDSSWEHSDFISDTYWSHTDQARQTCRGEPQRAWTTWKTMPVRYLMVMCDTDRAWVDTEPRKPRLEPDFESGQPLYDPRYGCIAAGPAQMPLLGADSPVYAQRDIDGLLGMFHRFDRIHLVSRVEAVWAKYTQSMFSGRPYEYLRVLCLYLGECKMRAGLVGAKTSERWTLDPTELRDYMIKWRAFSCKNPPHIVALCVSCKTRTRDPMFLEDNCEAGLCVCCGRDWILTYSDVYRIRRLEDEYQAYIVTNPSLRTEVAEPREHRVATIDVVTQRTIELKKELDLAQAQIKRLTQMAEESAVSCIICMDNAPNATFKDCGHTGFCLECAKSIQASRSPHCPMCRAELKEGALRLY